MELLRDLVNTEAKKLYNYLEVFYLAIFSLFFQVF